MRITFLLIFLILILNACGTRGALTHNPEGPSQIEFAPVPSIPYTAPLPSATLLAFDFTVNMAASASIPVDPDGLVLSRTQPIPFSIVPNYSDSVVDSVTVTPTGGTCSASSCDFAVPGAFAVTFVLRRPNGDRKSKGIPIVIVANTVTPLPTVNPPPILSAAVIASHSATHLEVNQAGVAWGGRRSNFIDFSVISNYPAAVVGPITSQPSGVQCTNQGFVLHCNFGITGTTTLSIPISVPGQSLVLRPTITVVGIFPATRPVYRLRADNLHFSGSYDHLHSLAPYEGTPTYRLEKIAFNLYNNPTDICAMPVHRIVVSVWHNIARQDELPAYAQACAAQGWAFTDQGVLGYACPVQYAHAPVLLHHFTGLDTRFNWNATLFSTDPLERLLFPSVNWESPLGGANPDIPMVWTP